MHCPDGAQEGRREKATGQMGAMASITWQEQWKDGTREGQDW
jgi:hypothetical protein